MEMLLVRHGHAVDDAPGLGDAGRWLSARGRKVTRRVARWLAKSKKRRPVVIWTSPLVRAAQTAELLAAEAGYKGEVRALAELSPGRDPGDLIKLLTEERPEGPIAIVGHEPSLSMLAAALVGDLGFGGFRKSGVLALTWEGGSGAGGSEAGEKGKARFLLDPAGMKVQKRDAIGRDPAAPPVSAR
jgi:phosphohistidine phosphatase